MPRMNAVRASTLRGWTGLALVALTPLALLPLTSGARLERADMAFNNGGEVSSLDPHTGSGVSESRIARALFEGLVTRDARRYQIAPAAAESWERARDGSSYTFLLRADLTWSNGDPLDAEDFVWSFRRLLAPATAAPFAHMLDCVAGVEAFRTGATEDWSQVGIRALDERRIEFELVTPRQLLDVLAHFAFVPVHRGSLERAREDFPNRWQVEWLRPERLVVNGPFRVRERRLGDRIRMERNPHYWDRRSVAFDTVDALSVEHLGTALNLFLTGELDWLDGTVPPGLVSELMDREDFLTAPYLGVYFYRFNVTRPPFDDVRVRRAFASAIDRNELTRLLGAGQRPALTFTPHGSIRGYPAPRLQVLPRTECLEQFEAAGFTGENRKPFPPVSIHFNNSELHRNVAEIVAAEWTELFGVSIGLAPQEQKLYLDAQRNLDYEVSRSSWIGDLIDPANFLEIWVSDGVNNRTGWSNAEYDRLIAEARGQFLTRERFALLARAERILLDELPMAPIYYYVSQDMVSPRLGGFSNNLLNDQFPKQWYWMDDAELTASRGRLPASKTPVERVRGPRQGQYSAKQEAARKAPRPSASGDGAGT